MRARPNGADASGTVVIKKDHRLEGGNIFHDRLTRIRTDGCLPVDYAREFRATRCSLNAQQISVSARYRLELEIPRNPTVVLFLKIPRVLCSHPLTGGPGFCTRWWRSAARRQTPNTKLQTPEKLQISRSRPSSSGVIGRGHWNLVPGISLVFGVWDLMFFLKAFPHSHGISAPGHLRG